MIVTQTQTQIQSKGYKNRVDFYDGHLNPRMARFHGLDKVDEERGLLTKLEDINNNILRYLSEEVPTGSSDRVSSCGEILQITNHLEEMRRLLQKEFQNSADRLYSQGKPTLKERLQHAVHELTDAISVYHQMAKEVPKTISATPSPVTPDLSMSAPMVTLNSPEDGFWLSPSFSNTPPIVPPVLLSDSREKINFCPRCGTSLSQSPPPTVPAVICGTSPAFSKAGDMNRKNPQDYSSACTIIICPSCTWKASNNTEPTEQDRNAFILTATAPLLDWNTGDTNNFWCI